jgi:hypothetical protein
MHDGWAVRMKVQQALQDLEGPALDGHVTDVSQVLLAVPVRTHMQRETHSKETGETS